MGLKHKKFTDVASNKNYIAYYELCREGIDIYSVVDEQLKPIEDHFIYLHKLAKKEIRSEIK